MAETVHKNLGHRNATLVRLLKDAVPLPTVQRYDEEGFFPNLEVKEFLENFGMKLEPIADECLADGKA